MSQLPSWQFPGGPASAMYRALDALRDGLNQRLVRYLTDKLPGSGWVVVEAGSGPSSGSSCFSAQPGVRLTVAADFDIAALRVARARDRRLPVVVADITRMPLASGCADLVWSSSTLEHLERLEERNLALSEMRRLARPGGHVFVGVPYLYGPLGFQRWIARTSVGHWIGTVFGGQEFRRVLEDAGLHYVSTRVYFFGFFVGILARKPSN
jgi:SAM-dependent methyltransferase